MKFNAIQAINIYRMVLAKETIKIKYIIGTRNIPATIVIGSPTKGTQLKSRVHLPYLWYQFEAFFNCKSVTGNHFFFLNLSNLHPINQLNKDPSILPKLAIKTKKLKEWLFNIIKLVKAISDCPGRIVADKNDDRKRPI